MIESDQLITSYTSVLSNKLKRLIRRLSLDGKYAPSQGRMLHFIVAHDEIPVYQKDLEVEFNIRPASVTQLLNKMEENGLIRREAVDGDGRLKRIVCTEKATQYKSKVINDLNEIEEIITKNLTEEEIRQWKTISQKMINNLE